MGDAGSLTETQCLACVPHGPQPSPLMPVASVRTRQGETCECVGTCAALERRRWCQWPRRLRRPIIGSLRTKMVWARGPFGLKSGSLPMPITCEIELQCKSTACGAHGGVAPLFGTYFAVTRRRKTPGHLSRMDGHEGTAAQAVSTAPVLRASSRRARPTREGSVRAAA